MLPGTKRTRSSYTYDKLCDLQLGSAPVNVIGVVVLFKPPYQSKGRDYTCTIEVVDDSCEKSPVPLIFFNRNQRMLPQSCSAGDVVCVRRVDIGEFNHRLQGKCRSHCSWLLWDGRRVGTGRHPPTATSVGASWEPHEMTRASDLLSWSALATQDSQQSTSSQLLLPLSQSPLQTSTLLQPLALIVLSEHKINAIGIVKSVSVPQKSRGPDYFISVVLIDETSSSDGLAFTLFNPHQEQLPKVGEPGSVAYLMNIKMTEYEGSVLGRGHQRSKVVCFSLQADGEMVWTASPDINLPNAVKERAKCLLEWVDSAQPMLNIVEDSQLDSQSQAPGPLPSQLRTTTMTSATECSNIREKVAAEPCFRPPTYLTLMLHPTWPITALKDIQESSDLPACFRIRVKVIQILQPLEECCQLRCPVCKYKFPVTHNDSICHNCSKRTGEGSNSELRFMYCISLLIADSSTTSHVHLSDTDAEEFFQNMPPANLREDDNTRQSLLKILTNLTGRRDPFLAPHNPSSLLLDKSCPWIDCCVQTYSSCKGTQLRMIDTWSLDSVHINR